MGTAADWSKTPTPIDWERIARAMKHYTDYGYVRVEVPWAVSKEIAMLTCPYEERLSEVTDLGTLVGSSEQSFMQMRMNGELPFGRYVACTPCFRVMDGWTDIHQPYFMKVELWNDVDNDAVVDPRSPSSLIEDAIDFMNAEISYNSKDPSKLNLEVTEAFQLNQDVLVNGIEMGSYGYRRRGNLTWEYGTGLAEPRFSTLVRTREKTEY